MTLDIVDTPPVDLDRLARQLKVLADPQRLRILHMLIEGIQCNCRLGDALGLPANLVSHHLRILRKAELIDAKRDPDDARWIHYSVRPGALTELNRAFQSFFSSSRIKPERRTCALRDEPNGLLNPSERG
jgi:ArsR family transcriptional regulator, arsenate/arsenite/antimonite-responsive transcriptional repressor